MLDVWMPCIYRDLRSFFGLKKIGGSRVGRLEKRHSNRCCGSGCDFLGPRQVLSRTAWPVWCGGGAWRACCFNIFNKQDNFVWIFYWSNSHEIFTCRNSMGHHIHYKST